MRIVSDTGNERHYIVAHGGAGFRITVDGKEVVVASPDAPLGQVLLNKEVGEEINFRADENKSEEWIIDAIY
ncbi:MAG: GreA/GreB family elongation factor [Deltaproteobacteria bacterium]|nr:GreA/GreB family elongation factor [Deltaproteobacteria bacterium]